MTIIERVCDILMEELDLDEDQIWLWDQKVNIPTDSRLYVSVGVVSCKPFSNNSRLVPVTGGLNEELSANFQATLSIDIMSRGTDARDRKEEVILALRSFYSLASQEANGFFIAPISSSFVNLSQLDGAAIPYRFNISVNVQYQTSKVKAVKYYDSFTDSVTTEA